MPNVLWICTDQQRYDTIHALGNAHIRTPHLDRLVESGVTFTQAYCQSPVCTPSRASFLTGRYPRTTRCRQNGQTIPSYERLVPRIFADHGYVCGLAGKLHLSSCSNGKVEQRIDDGYSVFHWSHHPQPDWPENAYSQWLAGRGTSWQELYTSPETGYVRSGVPPEYHQTTWCAEMAMDFIKQNRGQNWLFSVNLFDPHHPFDPPAEYLNRYNPLEMPLPKWRPGELDRKPLYQQIDHVQAHDRTGMDVQDLTHFEQQRITAAYYAMIELIDDQVGRMLATLEVTGQLHDTLVIFMSDHGELLGDHGLYLKGPHFYDESVRVPLVISWPGRFPAGLQSEALVELIDLAPTLLEACGLPLEPQLQGRSLLPLLQGIEDPLPPRKHVYCEYYNAWTHHRSYGSMLRTREHKIVRYHGTPDGELYDLQRDPDEFENLWNVPGQKALQLALLEQLCDACVLSMDPLPVRLGAF